MPDDQIVSVRNAELLRDQIKRTWNPPRLGPGQPADVAQTSVMQTLAFVMGREFLGELTESQEDAVRQGLRLLNQVLLRRPNHAG